MGTPGITIDAQAMGAAPDGGVERGRALTSTIGKLRSAREAWRLRIERQGVPGLSSAVATVRRWLLLHRPEWAFGVGVGLFLVLVALDFIPGSEDLFGSLDEQHPVAVGLGEHAVAAIVIGCVGYWWLFGYKRQKALKSYRRKLLDSDQKLVDWYVPKPYPVANSRLDGTAGRTSSRRRDRFPRPRASRESAAAELPRLRERTCERLGEEIIHSRSPAVAIVKGRAGTGRSSFILELVDYLANKGLVPIPLLARHGGKFDLEQQARERFFRNIESTASADDQDAIWHFARQTRGIVVLVDGLDKELFEELEDDEEKRASAITDLQGSQIHLVLATTLDLDLEFNVESNLGIDQIPSLLREDLDRFTYDEAGEYLDGELGSLSGDACAALGEPAVRDDETLVDPFYLDLLVCLTQAKLLKELNLAGRRTQSDKWRQLILERYLRAVREDQLADAYEKRLRFGDKSPSKRGLQAYRAAQTVAARLDVEQDLTVEKAKLKDVDADALLDAKQLNLIRVGPQRVSFSSDELGAYIYAELHGDPRKLLEIVAHVAEGEVGSLRHQRFGLIALTFWLLEHPAERSDTFDELLKVLENSGNARPRLAAAALRILNACPDLACNQESKGRVVELVHTSVAHLAAPQSGQRRDPDPNGPVRLVRALSNWSDPDRHVLLWRLARSRNLEVVWPAIKALAGFRAAAAEQWSALDERFNAILDEADGEKPRSLSEESSELGNDLASLAWLLPALRSDDRCAHDPIEEQWLRLKEICRREGLSPLRGEMALAQGLKLAALMKRRVDYEEIEELLVKEPLRFWHARLVLVHAVVAHAWRDEGHRQRCLQLLCELHENEAHELTARAIALGIEGLKTADSKDPVDEAQLYEYLWSHEHDAVTWVEQRKWKVSQLAADVVLLSNMTYELWKKDEETAEQWACDKPIPSCIADSSRRMCIIDPEWPDDPCGCPLCTAGSPAVLGTWARFTEAFCRDQARLVALQGPPAWVRRNGAGERGCARELKRYWRYEAQHVAALQLGGGGIARR